MQPLTRAVVVEPASPGALLPLLETRPFALLPVGAQTLVGRLLTQLAAAGLSEVDLLLRHLPEQTRAVVGDGARWGLTLRCHDVSSSPAETSLQAFAESCLAGRGIAVGMDAMFDAEALKQWTDQSESGHTLVTDDSGDRVLLCVLGDSFAQRKQATCGSVRCIGTPADLWAENADALRSHGTTLHIERSLGDACYAGAGSRIAKDARIAGPALLGAGVAIASQAGVGPNVIVGADVVIDEAAQVSDSLILSGTYIGPHTTIRGKIVDAGKVLDIRTQTVARIDDPTLVGSTRIATSDGSLWTVAGGLLVALGTLGYNSLFLASRSAQAILGNALLRTCNVLLAAGLLLFVAPLTLLFSVLRQPRSRVLKAYARRGERIEYRVTRLFRRGHPLWCMNYAPVLWHVLSGRIALTGPRLSSIAGGIPIYAHAAVAPGLLSPSTLQKRTGFARQKRQFADAMFVTQASLKSHFLLAARFMLSLVLGATPRSMPPQVELMRVPIANLSMNQALRRIAQMCTSKGLQQVAFVNADCLNISSYDTEYRALLRRIPLVLADGIGLRQALKWFHRIGLRDNVNGTDLFPRLCRQAALHGWRVYFLGGRPGIAAKAAANAQASFPRLTVAGTRDGYFSEADTKHVIADINASGADILLVALGVPRQDLWIAHHAGELRVRVAMGVGGLFDFYSGTIPRAPQWMREVGLEWIYRLMQEPGRMWRRYLIGNPLFIWRAWRSSRRAPQAAATAAGSHAVAKS